MTMTTNPHHSIQECVSILPSPWMEAVVPAFNKKAHFFVDKQEVHSILRTHRFTSSPTATTESRPSISFKVPAEGLLDIFEFQKRASSITAAFDQLGYGPPVRASPMELRDEQFFAVALRYLLPFNRQAPNQVLRLAAEIKARYSDVPYHHGGHATSVAYDTVKIANCVGLWQAMNELEKKAIVVAALGHDLGHPGKNEMFLRNINHPLAMMYNDRSVLENYHCATLCQLLSREECAVLQNNTIGRRLVIRCILATDIYEHHKILVEARNQFKTKSPNWAKCIAPMVVKAADLAYLSARPQVMLDWTIAYYQEQLEQSAVETYYGYPTTERTSLESMGTTSWLEKNATFIETIYFPIVQYLIDVEWKFKKKKLDKPSSMEMTPRQRQDGQYKNVSFEMSETLAIPNGEGDINSTPRTSRRGEDNNFGYKSDLQTIVDSLRTCQATSLSHLADFVAEEEGRLAVENWNGPQDYTPQTGNLLNSIWKDKPSKKKSRIYQELVVPLEKNAKSLRNSKYIKKLLS